MYEDLLNAINSIPETSEDPVIHGLHLATMTGEVIESDQTYIEVEFLGQSYAARYCSPIGSYAIPTKEWVQEFGTKWFAVIGWEAANPAHPICMGVCPMDGTAPVDRSNHAVYGE